MQMKIDITNLRYSLHKELILNLIEIESSRLMKDDVGKQNKTAFQMTFRAHVFVSVLPDVFFTWRDCWTSPTFFFLIRTDGVRYIKF